MLGVGLAFVWCGALALAWIGSAAIERRARFVLRRDRSGFTSAPALWGGGVERPAGHSMLVRLLAGGARIVRARSVVSGRAHGLRFAARGVACIALASALALVPFAGSLGGRASDPPLVVVDLEPGLVALVLCLFLAAIAQVAVGISEASPFARLACVRLAGRSLALVGLLAIVLAPLALATGSLRLHAIAMDQLGRFAPLAWLGDLPGAEPTGPLSSLFGARFLPAWFVFRQPITALLFVPVVGLLTRRPLALDAVGGGVRLSAFGHDDDAGELYWARVEERLASVLFASLFVALFLGAGAVPYCPTSWLVAPIASFFGEGFAALVAACVETSVFVAKLALVLVASARAARITAALRDDQWIGIATRRFLPLAWANLLWVAALSLLSGVAAGGRS